MGTANEILSTLKFIRDGESDFISSASADHGIPRYQSIYCALLTLCLNTGTRFSFENLAAHMPYPANANHLHDDIQRFLRAKTYENCFEFETDESRQFDNRFIHFKSDGSEVENNFKLALQELESLHDVSLGCLFPTQPNPLDLFQYYDENLDDTLVFENDLSYGILPQWSKSHSIFVNPISFEFRALNDDSAKLTLGRESEADSKIYTDFLRKKFIDANKQLVVASSFSQDHVDFSLTQNHATLITFHDLHRFLYLPSWLYQTLDHDPDGPEIGLEFAPVLSEWNQLLRTHGIASIKVLEIIKNRLQKPSPDYVSKILEKKKVINGHLTKQIQKLEKLHRIQSRNESNV